MWRRRVLFMHPRRRFRGEGVLTKTIWLLVTVPEPITPLGRIPQDLRGMSLQGLRNMTRICKSSNCFRQFPVYARLRPFARRECIMESCFLYRITEQVDGKRRDPVFHFGKHGWVAGDRRWVDGHPALWQRHCGRGFPRARTRRLKNASLSQRQQ